MLFLQSTVNRGHSYKLICFIILTYFTHFISTVLPLHGNVLINLKQRIA